jgi:predicted N-acetyltransferase YhbS
MRTILKNVEYMIRKAFWDLYKPGCVEHPIAHNMRNSPDFVKELDYVAFDGDMIIGNRIYPRAKVINDEKMN